MVRAMPDQACPRRTTSTRLLMVAALIAAVVALVVTATIAAADQGIRAALLDRQAAGLFGTVGAFGVALLLGDVLHSGSRRQHE